MNEVQTVDDDGAEKKVHFGEVSITGGPHPRSVEVSVDGETIPRLFHAELVLDVDKPLMLKTEQYVAISSVKLQKAGWEQRHVATVHVWEGTPGEDAEKTEYTGKGDDAPGALEDAARQIREAAS